MDIAIPRSESERSDSSTEGRKIGLALALKERKIHENHAGI